MPASGLTNNNEERTKSEERTTCRNMSNKVADMSNGGARTGTREIGQLKEGASEEEQQDFAEKSEQELIAQLAEQAGLESRGERQNPQSFPLLQNQGWCCRILSPLSGWRMVRKFRDTS